MVSYGVFGGFRLLAQHIFFFVTALAFAAIGHADSSGGHPINGPRPEFDPACTVLSVEGPEFEYWVSWDGPVVAPGIPLTLENFLNCPFGRRIVHPIVCITVTMACSGADPTAKLMCFHAGSGADGKLEVFPTDYRKPEAKRGRFTVPGLTPISTDTFKEFWEWYERSLMGDFGGLDFCHAPSEERPTHNCGSYFLLILSKLLGKTPDEVRALIPQLGKCTHISYDLYPPSFFEKYLAPLLLLPSGVPPGGGFGVEIETEGSMCPAIAGVLAEPTGGELGIESSGARW